MKAKTKKTTKRRSNVGPGMVIISLYLNEATHKKLLEVCDGRSKCHVIRKAMEEYLFNKK